MVTLNGGIGAIYSFDTYQAAIKSLNGWFEKELISEKECMGFIIQMFHQIPEEMYNQIIDEVSV